MTPLNVDMLKGDLRILAIKSFLEKATAFVRGNGQKTLSIIDVLVDVPEDQIPRSGGSDRPVRLILCARGTEDGGADEG